MLGPTSAINAFFMDASIGYILGNASEFWFSLARWGGLPMLAVFPVLVSALLAQAALKFPEWRTVRLSLIGAGTVFILFLSLSVAAGYAAEHGRGIATAWGSTEELIVVAGMTDFPAKLEPDPEMLAARTEIVFEMARQFSEYDIQPDVIILPETIGSRIDMDGYARITELLPKGTLIVYSKYAPYDDRTIAQLRAHTIGGDTSVIDKQLIMPYGEYPPYHFLAPLWIFNRDLYDAVRRYREYDGGTTTVLGEAHGVPIGVRACSEIFSPQLYRTLAQNGAGLLAQSSSIKIFEGAPLLESTMRSAARIRAVENGLPLVQAFNGGSSQVFDCRGKEIHPTLVADTFKVYSIPRSAVCAGY
jgi:apolipoprotein N-acyltransferase